MSAKCTTPTVYQEALSGEMTFLNNTLGVKFLMEVIYFFDTAGKVNKTKHSKKFQVHRTPCCGIITF